MSLFSLLFRDTLTATTAKVSQTAVVDELDNLTANLSAWALVNHNEDGTHNTRTTSGLDLIPVGGMVYWPLTTAPTGWLIANGAAVSRTSYPILFQTIGIVAGAGDGTATFNLPNVANHIILVA